MFCFLTRESISRSNDTWGLGCLMFEVFNGRLMKRGALKSTAKVGRSSGDDVKQSVRTELGGSSCWGGGTQVLYIRWCGGVRGLAG